MSSSGKVLFKDFHFGFTGERQSMLVENDRVLERGPLVSGEASKLVDLRDVFVLPSFNDCHCHVLPSGLDLLKLDLSACATRQDYLDLLRDRNREQPDGWLLAVQYDQNRLGGEHLTRAELDQISGARPILLKHVSGHASVANTSALAAAKVDEHTLDPSGGTFRRDVNGCLDGVLLEDAHEIVSKAIPMPTVEQMTDAILVASENMRAQGIGCAADMMTGWFDLKNELLAYRKAAERGCAIHLRLYLQWKTVFGPRAVPPDELAELLAYVQSPVGSAVSETGRTTSSVKVGGIKIFADGAFGSATAAIYGEYTGAPPARGWLTNKSHRAVSRDGRTVHGQLIYNPERLKEMVLTAGRAGYSVATHVIGDYAADLVMDAYEATGDPSKHRIEHAMLLSDQQIERLAALRCPVSFQPEFLLRLSSNYFLQLGPERASKLERTRSLIDAGVNLAFSSDRPIVPGNPWDGIHTAENRPKGFDPEENCSRLEALDAYTAMGALINGEPGEMGTLKPGSLADFQILSFDPVSGN